LAALVVTLLAGVLVIVEITDGAMRRWWAGHALTTGTVSGLLVLLITLLVVDQVVRLRQLNARARTVAAQAAGRRGATAPGRLRPTACGARPKDPGRPARRRIRLTGTEVVTPRQRSALGGCPAG
jgi:hypothetical protein